MEPRGKEWMHGRERLRWARTSASSVEHEHDDEHEHDF
jgi:hypothetical protein